MRRVLLILLSLPLCGAPLHAQQLNPEEYVFPLREVGGYCSANFGEMRPDHFHSGVDIKTDGVTGKPVVAAADGYVSRIAVSPTGYGLALYVAHPNGTTSVYGHLSAFRDDIARFVRSERIRQRKNRIDLSCVPGQFPVRRGERIALSGNSGSSFGPHLHFEIRNSHTQRTLNTIAAGVIRPKDHIPPYLVRLHYVEVDTVRGVAVESPLRSYDLRKVDSRTYALASAAPIPVGRCGYFILEATDRKDGVSNTFGLYQVRLHVDGRLRFEYRMEGFTFDRTRYCNSAACYALQLTSRNEAIRLARQEGCPEGLFHPVAVDRGAVDAAAGERRELRIEAQDDCGNRSQLAFTIEGIADEARFRAPQEPDARTVDCRSGFRAEIDSLTVEIPAGALYSPLFFRGGRSELRLPADTTLRILSPVYEVLDRSIPLHKAVNYTLRTEVPPALAPHAVLATLSRTGRIVPLGGSYRDGALRCSTRTLGPLFVVAETRPPLLQPLFADGADLSGAREIGIRMTDDFSGIASYSAAIDGEWVILDYLPRQGLAVHRFDGPQPARGMHTLRIEATDGCGNTAVRELRFRR